MEQSLLKPDEYAAAADQQKYRAADQILATCSVHGVAAVACVNAGKRGRKGRTAAIGATVFWLTCPHLNNLIARWERCGAVSKLSDTLRTHSALLEAHVASHEVYESRVLSLLPEGQRQFFKEHYIDCSPDKRKFGNAAVRHSEDVKCLHALVAQAMCGSPNPLGDALLAYIHGVHLHVSELTSTEDGTAAKLHCHTSIRAVVDDMDSLQTFVGEFSLHRECVHMQDKPFDAHRHCMAAAEILMACEGHAPRMRKKHRRN